MLRFLQWSFTLFAMWARQESHTRHLPGVASIKGNMWSIHLMDQLKRWVGTSCKVEFKQRRKTYRISRSALTHAFFWWHVNTPVCRVMLFESLPLWMISGGAFRPSAQHDAITVTLMEAKPVDLITTCLLPWRSTVCVLASSKYTAVSSMQRVLDRLMYWYRILKYLM